jgi:hypothetical protein
MITPTLGARCLSLGLMRRWERHAAILLCVFLFFGASARPAAAHRSGCHRWHSCPSDRGTYECGDLGYCSACPDNHYCLLGKPRREPKKDDREGQSNQTKQQPTERQTQK